MNETEQKDTTQLESLRSAELEKTKLEVQGLKNNLSKKKGFSETFSSYLPLLTALIAVFGFLFGIYQFNMQQQQQSVRDYQAKEKEFKRVLWEKQLELYLEVSKIAAQLAATSDENERKTLYKELSSHFNGDLIVVEDRQVMEAVLEFDQLYEVFLADLSRQEDLLASARKLARACRNSLVKTFDVQLGDLRDYKE